MKSYKIISQYSDEGDMVKAPLMGSVNATATPRRGFIAYDQWCASDAVRSDRPITGLFNAVNAWIMKDVIVSNYHILHKYPLIYIDSSIYSCAHQGELEREVFDRFLTAIKDWNGDYDSSYQSERALILYNEGGGTWGHFLIQDIPKVKIYLDNFPNGRIALPSEHCIPEYSPYASAIIACGAKPDQLIALQADVHYRFGEAILVDMMYDFGNQAPHPFALELFRALGTEFVGGAASRHRNYIKRSKNYGRNIDNDASVDFIIESHGIEKIDFLEKENFSDQIRTWKKSKIIISVLGSNLANMVFGAEEGAILAISPDWFGDLFFYNLAAFLGITWHELRCGRRKNHGAVGHRSDFLVYEALLETCLNDVDKIYG